MNHLLITKPSLFTFITSRKPALASRNHISTWENWLLLCQYFSPKPRKFSKSPC